MTETKEVLFSCPLCGFQFPGGAGCRAGCPFRNNCGLICCPRCRYQFVGESKSVNWLKKVWSGRRKKEGR